MNEFLRLNTSSLSDKSQVKMSDTFISSNLHTPNHAFEESKVNDKFCDIVQILCDIMHVSYDYDHNRCLHQIHRSTIAQQNY